MICQFCEIEHPAGARSCSQCGCDLVASLAVEGEELTFDPLPIIDDRATLAALVSQLEADCIPYTVHCGTGLQMYETQSLGAVAPPGTWEARVMVISSRYAEADAALRAAAAGAEARGFGADSGEEQATGTSPERSRRFGAIEPR